MFPTRPFTKRRQAGDAILEALVGMLILCLVVAGSTVALGRGAKLQYSNNLRAQAIDQLRSKMMATGVSLCGTSVPLSVGNQTLSATVACTPYTNVLVTFAGVSGAIAAAVPTTQAQIMTATLTASALGGTLTVSSNQ